ncbi:MAG: hypothetical protein ACLP4V_28160 [Methylocella sp.]
MDAGRNEGQILPEGVVLVAEEKVGRQDCLALACLDLAADVVQARRAQPKVELDHVVAGHRHVYELGVGERLDADHVDFP